MCEFPPLEYEREPLRDRSARRLNQQRPVAGSRASGKGGGTLSPGRHVVYRHNTPLTNLFVEMLDRVGVRVASFGDSTGRLPALTV